VRSGLTAAPHALGAQRLRPLGALCIAAPSARCDNGTASTAGALRRRGSTAHCGEPQGEIMSIPVDLSNLASEIARYRFAYLMTANDNGAPHAVAVAAGLQAGELVVDGIGSHTRVNALQRPAVGLVWPPRSESGYSLIVDGQAAVVGTSLRITPTRAVLHRPAPAPEPRPPGACASDCVELDLGR